MDALQVPASRPTGVGAGRLRTILVLAVVAVLVIAAAWFLGQPSGDVTVRAGEAPAGEAPRIGDTPPDFEATAIDGTAVSMAAFAGRPTWLTFGASWCPDCRAEATDLQETYAKYAPQGLVVLGVFIDEPESAAADYAKRVGFTFPLVSDPQGRIADLYRTYGIPIHFFVGRDGTIQDVRIGRLTPDDMEQVVQQLVNG
ncbi:MAG: TlpA family protein disulfide reductase [Chloroflexi bacterium]|jgi:peroxiredoxin|nr:TlpA family protein disulfide reductase [Chloroflexota bacterium]